MDRFKGKTAVITGGAGPPSTVKVSKRQRQARNTLSNSSSKCDVPGKLNGFFVNGA